MKTGKGSRCRVVILHLIINWISYNLTLAVVLYHTSTDFDSTEWAAILAMVIVTIGLGAMQYDIWKARYDLQYSKPLKRRKEDLVSESSEDNGEQ